MEMMSSEMKELQEPKGRQSLVGGPEDQQRSRQGGSRGRGEYALASQQLDGQQRQRAVPNTYEEDLNFNSQPAEGGEYREAIGDHCGEGGQSHETTKRTDIVKKFAFQRQGGLAHVDRQI